MKIKHILWDWNGTLINDVDLCVKAVNTLLERRQKELICRDFYRQHFTFPVIDFYRLSGFNFDEESFSDVSEEWMSVYKNGFRHESLLQPDTLKTLEDCRSFTQSILSACELNFLNESVDFFGLNKFFGQVHGTDNIEAHGKVDLAKRMLEAKHFEPSESVLIGDTLHDHEVAEAVGMHCILISHGHQDYSRLASTGTTIVESFQDIPKALRKL